MVLLSENSLAALGPRFEFLPLQSLGIVGLTSNSQPVGNTSVRPDIRMTYDMGKSFTALISGLLTRLVLLGVSRAPEEYNNIRAII